MSTPTDRPWWRDAVFYQVYVRSFADSDGDGLGDLPGITSRLPYLRSLGVDAVWITPFYPSPQRDAGYDVADYRDVDPRFGTLADADALLAEGPRARAQVIVDLVPNHTSPEHAWFQRAAGQRARAARSARATCSARAGAAAGRSRPTTGSPSSAARPGPAWRTASGTCTCSTPRSPTSTGETRGGGEFEDVLRFWLDRGVGRLPDRRRPRHGQGRGPCETSAAWSRADRSPARPRGALGGRADRARSTDVGPARGARHLPGLAPGARDVRRRPHGRRRGVGAVARRRWRAYVRPDELQPGLQLRLAARALVGHGASPR